MPPLVIDDAKLDQGLAIVAESIEAVTAGELVGAAGGSAR